MPNTRQRVFGLSDVGKSREVNEDQFLVADLNKSMLIHHTTLAIENETRLFSGVEGQLLLVADGMGGYAAGERASQLTTDTIAQHILNTMPWFFRLHHEHEDDLSDELRAAVVKCEQVVDKEAHDCIEERGMGTTLTLAYVIWPRMFVVHVGDSRCYVLRDGRLEQITRDDTVAQAMYEAGSLTAEEAKQSSMSHVLVNTIGHGVKTVHPEVYKVDLLPQDSVLLCTDGLTDRVSDNEIVDILATHASESQACQALVDAANEAGGNDNITVIVSRYPAE